MKNTTNEIPTDLISIQLAADLTGRPKPTLYEWANRSGKLQRYPGPDGKTFRVSRAEVERRHAELASRKSNGSAKAAHPPVAPSPVVRPSAPNDVGSLPIGEDPAAGETDKTPDSQVGTPMATGHAVLLARIKFHADTQVREKIDPETVRRYAEKMRTGERFPPVILFGDRERGELFIGDGWHRLKAAKQNCYQSFPAEVRPGGLAEAADHALSANASHGKPRTREDIRRIVKMACRRHPGLSNRQIATLCAVDDKTVATHRGSCGNSAPEKRIGADGKSYPAAKPKREPGRRSYEGLFKRLRKAVRKLPRNYQESLRDLLQSILARPAETNG
jgi:hypothetical protein